MEYIYLHFEDEELIMNCYPFEKAEAIIEGGVKTSLQKLLLMKECLDICYDNKNRQGSSELDIVRYARAEKRVRVASYEYKLSLVKKGVAIKEIAFWFSFELFLIKEAFSSEKVLEVLNKSFWLVGEQEELLREARQIIVNMRVGAETNRVINDIEADIMRRDDF